MPEQVSHVHLIGQCPLVSRQTTVTKHSTRMRTLNRTEWLGMSCRQAKSFVSIVHNGLILSL